MIVQELEIPLSQVTLQGLHGYVFFPWQVSKL